MAETVDTPKAHNHNRIEIGFTIGAFLILLVMIGVYGPLSVYYNE